MFVPEMNSMKRFIVIAALTLAALGAYMAWKGYTEGPRDLTRESAELRMDARELYERFSSDETAANAEYLDKVIELRGEILAVDTAHPPTIQLATDDMLGVVSCEMAELEGIPEEGKTVIIKGQCTGYLTDVVMVKCVMITTKDRKQ
jgi:hypothetical protein